jgi:protein-S-isoprenylcysteine O-methyltransferase Ste14
VSLLVYLEVAVLLAAASIVVFRIFVRTDYRDKGRLSPLTSFFQLLIWGLLIFFPFLYNPPEWVLFWSDHVPVGTGLRVVGVATVAIGMVLAFGTMAWFGIVKAVGLKVHGFVETGPYRLTRNPQIVSGALMVIGMVMLWPTWYSLGWICLYGIVSHVMVLTEEEHLKSVFGVEYERYCARVPRYVGTRLRS